MKMKTREVEGSSKKPLLKSPLEERRLGKILTKTKELAVLGLVSLGMALGPSASFALNRTLYGAEQKVEAQNSEKLHNEKVVERVVGAIREGKEDKEAFEELKRENIKNRKIIGEEKAAELGVQIIRNCSERKNCNLEEVVRLIANGANVNADFTWIKKVAMEVADRGNKEVVEMLIRAGADVNAADKRGRTLLMWAAGNGHLSTVEILIKAGANVNAVEASGWTALMGAAANGHTAVIEMLIRAGADVNTNKGKSALIMAAMNGQKESAEALIKAGAKLDAQDENGKTALMWAVINGYKEVVELLLQNGANPSVKDFEGNSAMDMAFDSSIKKMLKEAKR
ncbi:MAG: ankyrin repeat domain-containing protein [Candidatus Anstonellales archaeon]